jgi:uncharacterized membrane protein
MKQDKDMQKGQAHSKTHAHPHDLHLADQFTRKAHATPARSLAKTVTWRMLGSFDTFLIAYITTGQAKIGLTIASAEVLTKIALYYLHERGWAHVRWGLKEAPLKPSK